MDNELDQTIDFPPPSLSILENSASGTSAGTLSATVSDGGTVTFAATHAVFDVASTGEVTLAAGQILDYEAQDIYTIEVTASANDAPKFVQYVIVSVVNIDQEGTADEPYQIDTLAELQSIAIGFQNEELDEPLTMTDSLAAHYIQTADIDATPTASGTWQMSVDDSDTPSDPDDVTQHGFLPIGNCGADNSCFSYSSDNKPFTGSFDGDGYTISGLHIDRSITNGVGLFGRTDSAALRNLALEGGSVTGDWYVGGLVGWNDGGSIESSYAIGDVTGDNSVGGLVGNSSGTIESSYAIGDVTGNNNVGGLVGNSSGTIESSYAIGDVTGFRHVGGLVGQNGGTIEFSYAIGDVTGSNRYVGGLVGQNGGTIEFSYAIGDVTGSNRYVGGLVGQNGGTIENSFAIGDVAGRFRYVGGLVGFNEGTVQRGYCVDVSGVNCVGSNPNGTVTSVSDVSLSTLKSRTCSNAVFRDSDGYGCATAGAANFPWDFGSSSELPVINGLVGGLDPAGQHALLNFDASSLAQSFLPGDEVTLDASELITANDLVETGNALEYLWSIPPDITDAVFASDGSSVTFTALIRPQEVGLTIIERDVNGNIVRIYSDAIAVVIFFRVDSLTELQSIATGFQNEELDEPLSLEDSLAVHYVLTANIDATPTADWNDGGFLPIGNCGADNVCSDLIPTSEIDESADDEIFTGSFDGNGYAIDGLHIDRPTTDRVGLFGRADGAVLRNIALEGGSVTGDDYVGGLVGLTSGSIESSYATGAVTGGDYVGGLVGFTSGPIESSYATGAVTGGDYVGGLVGYKHGGRIESSYATGDVTGGDYGGGLVGFTSGSIESSYATGAVSGGYNGVYVGGLVGYKYDSWIQSSYATGAVSGGDHVGRVGRIRRRGQDRFQLRHRRRLR